MSEVKTRPERNSRATIVDVARKAGVSIGTVSRVLNKAPTRPETLQRVMRAVEELAYVPNHAAQSLKRQAVEQIGIVVPDIANPVYVAMAKAAQQAAKERGYSLSFMSTEDNPSEELGAIRNIERRHVDGLIFCSLRPTSELARVLTRLRDRVSVIGRPPEGARIDSVQVDSAAGVRQAVWHLAGQGRQRLAFINGPTGTVPADTRARGFAQAVAQNHLELNSALMLNADFTMTGGYAATSQLLSGGHDFDGIFCANDVMALGALRRLQEAGVSVPAEVAVIGVDDTEYGRLSTPTLSTVSLQAAERGRLAAEMLLRRITHDEPDPETHTVTVAPRLIIRESSGTSTRQVSHGS